MLLIEKGCKVVKNLLHLLHLEEQIEHCPESVAVIFVG